MKKPITRPFDRYRLPPRQLAPFLPFIWLGCWLITRPGHLKVERFNMAGLKPPYIVLANHQAFMDFIVTALVLFPHRANYISELEGFELYGGEFYRRLGALGTRKFINDRALITNIKRVVDRGDIIVIYPEARYANVGTNTIIPDSVGKLCKLLNVPVVTLNMSGNYLRQPIWNTKKRSGVRLKARLQQLIRPEELKALDIGEINERIRTALTYDEYRYQLENKIKIKYKRRAEGLERVIYKCPVCGCEFRLQSRGAELFCPECGSSWFMDEYGRLVGQGKTLHIPDLYRWQEEQVRREIDRGEYAFEGQVRIESLPNEYNFIPLGMGYLKHCEEGFYLTLKDYGEPQEKTLLFSSRELLSIHTEYNYRGKGPCITLSTLDNTYFIYPECEGFNPTKLQFATEWFYGRR